MKCRHFPGFTALSHLAIATKISHSYHFHPTTNIPHNHQSWENEDKKWLREVFLYSTKKYLNSNSRFYQQTRIFWWHHRNYATKIKLEEDPSRQHFFTEIINSISTAKFAPTSDNYLFSRDYLSVHIWDVRNNT